MTTREKRLVRYASIGVAIYLVLFGGYLFWGRLENFRKDYEARLAEAQALKHEITRYEDKIAVAKKLMETYHLDPAALKRSSVVADASAAIQKTAMAGGFQLGPIRESPSRTSGKELATIQFEGSGQVKPAVELLSRLKILGYPLVVDSAQITADPMRPGQVKLTLTVVILDFEQWLKETVPNA
jgi:hypothetical protein